MIEILIAGAIVLVIGIPLVIAFDKWKKEMDATEEEKDESEDE